MRSWLVAALLAGSAPATAAPLHQYASLDLTPAGDRVAAIETNELPNSAVHQHGRIVFRSATTGSKLETLDPCADCEYSGLTFTPDGRLLFLASAKGSARLLIAGRGKTITLATIKGIAQDPLISPDGKSIAVLVTINAQKQSGATQPGVRQVGEIGETNDEQRIAVVSMAGGVLKPVTPADRYVYEYDWTPDSRGFVTTSAQGNGDDNWWIATLDRVDLSNGALQRIAAPDMQIDFPRVSPDGQTVAYIGGVMSDFGSVGGDVYTVAIGGGAPKDLTAGTHGTFTSLVWDRNGLAASTLAGDSMAIVPLDPRGGLGAPLWSAPVSISAGNARFARSANATRYATVVQDFEHAPAIYAGPPAGLQKISHDNDSWTSLVRSQSVTWKNGGFDVQGWLLAPRAVSSQGKQPMIVSVHGGPASANTPGFLWQGSFADLANAGYYIFLPNPRGSYGQGEKFTRANIRDFGGGDLKDILAGIDAVERVAPVDDDRLGLIGYSYGGFMAMWANTQTDRFKAIAGGGGLSDWISYYGTNGIDKWMIPYFGASLYDDPAPYWAVSAIRTIKTAHTPMFLFAGELDVEVPPTQSVEYWHALKARNVPVSLVIYPGEGHGIRQPKHSLDVRRRVVAWFNRYLSVPDTKRVHP